MSERAALRYAAQGWHVLPVIPEGKAPLTPHGLKDATTDPKLIKAWWCKWPDANVGIACGPSGLVVVDIDPRNGGSKTAAILHDEHGFTPTLAVSTGGGGAHLYYLGGGPSRANCLGPGVDIKGAGGYVVAPPSIHATGGQYKWDMRPDLELAELPLWIAKRLNRPELPKHEARPYRYRACGSDLDELREALSHIASDDYDTWLRVGMAIHHETGGSGEGRALWDAWSQQSSKYRAKDQARTWASIGSEATGTVTAGSIFYEAKANGWRPRREPGSPWSGWPHLPDSLFRALLSVRRRYGEGREICLTIIASRTGTTSTAILEALASAPATEQGHWARALASALKD